MNISANRQTTPKGTAAGEALRDESYHRLKNLHSATFGRTVSGKAHNIITKPLQKEFRQHSKSGLSMVLILVQVKIIVDLR